MSLDGDKWVMTAADTTVRVRDTKGMRYLAELAWAPDEASSRLTVPCTLNVADVSYKSGTRSMVVAGGASRSMVMGLSRSHQWYDFAVTLAGAAKYRRRYAGRVETGKSGFSDPAMA